MLGRERVVGIGSNPGCRGDYVGWGKVCVKSNGGMEKVIRTTSSFSSESNVGSREGRGGANGEVFPGRGAGNLVKLRAPPWSRSVGWRRPVGGCGCLKID